MNIHTLLDLSSIEAGCRVSGKSDLINRLVDLLEPSIGSNCLEPVRRSVFEREEVMSTGVGKQLAIPHGKCQVLNKVHASFALLSDPVDFDSIDDQPVKMALLLVGPDSHSKQHIQLLSRISRLMNSGSFRDNILQCSTAEEIHETMRKEEKHYFRN
ncbi:MAG: PTS transporter subunit EIIA [Bacteroidetes bacterium]|jgi:PTS system fructose-specific IIA component|nr:PTS transporter subunit EIIA [Bacteroidota bacterium]